MIGLNRERGWREGDSRTESLYMPEKKRLRDMTLEELRRGLCLRSDGNENVCRSCRGQCAFGLRALKLVEARGQNPSGPCGEGHNPSGPCGATSPCEVSYSASGIAKSPVATCAFNQRLKAQPGGDLESGLPSKGSPERESCRREVTEGSRSLGAKLTKNQMAHAECMKRQRRNRVAKARALIAAGTPESIAALAAGYGNASAYRKAEAKCRAEARKEQDRHV